MSCAVQPFPRLLLGVLFRLALGANGRVSGHHRESGAARLVGFNVVVTAHPLVCPLAAHLFILRRVFSKRFCNTSVCLSNASCIPSPSIRSEEHTSELQ